MSLAARIAEGDLQAARVLYDRYSELLFAFIHHRCNGDRVEAEDIWQETLVAAIRGMRGFRGQSTMFTWMRRIAEHITVDHYRQAQRHQGISFSELPEAALAELRAYDTLPEEQFQRETLRVTVLETLASLPDKYRIALIARYCDGSSVKQVAQLLGKRYKAAESILSRAREAFRRAFSRELQEGDHGQEPR